MAHDQLEMFSLPNPCVGVCESNRFGYCKGCLRSREERFNWHAKTEPEQRQILTLLSKRRTRLLKQVRQQSGQESTQLNHQTPTQKHLFDEFNES